MWLHEQQDDVQPTFGADFVPARTRLPLQRRPLESGLVAPPVSPDRDSRSAWPPDTDIKQHRGRTSSVRVRGTVTALAELSRAT